MSRRGPCARASPRTILAAAALMVLLECAAASATTVKTFHDRANDAPGAPDIRTVKVSQEGDVLEVDAQVVGLPLAEPGRCDIALDTDGNPATGLAGAEYVVGIDLKTFQPVVAQRNGTKYVPARKVADPSRTIFGKDDCGLMFNLANFGWPHSISLTIAVSAGSASSALTDVAPNHGQWTFPIVQQPESLDFSFEPAWPTAGSSFAATAPTFTMSDKTTSTPSHVTCDATLAGAELAPAGDAGACRWRIPPGATGEQLVVTATAAYRGTKTTYDPWSFRVG